MPSFFGYVGFVMLVPVCLALVVTLPAKLSGSIDEPFAANAKHTRTRARKPRRKVPAVRIRNCLLDAAVPMKPLLKPKWKSRCVRSENGFKDRNLDWLAEHWPSKAGPRVMRRGGRVRK